jgi:enoyl-CoA hydratase/carnithine racemase
VSLVTRTDHGRVSVLTLCNPPANGYSHAMHRALDAHVVELRMDPGCDVIVLRGEGDRFFCAGADIGYLQSLDPEQKYAFCLHANETLLRLEHTPKLVIAALNGHCVGGGLEIALACDLRIGRASATGKPNLVGLPEVALGVLPGTGGTQRLTRVLGRARALAWMIEGTNVSVEEALTAGLVHRVLPAEGWWEAVLALAASFTRPHKAAGAVGLIKRAVLGGADLPLESGLALERELQMRLFSAPDAREGLAAFLEKRAPHFTGAPSVATSPSFADPGAGGPPPATPPADVPRRPASTTPGTALATAAPGPDDRVDAHGEDSDAPGWTYPERDLRGFEGFEDFADFGPEEDADPSAFDTSLPSGAGAPGRVDLLRTRLHDDVLNLLTRDLVERHRCIPVRVDADGLLLAMVEPSEASLREIAAHTGLPSRAVAAPLAVVATLVRQHYRP